MTEVWPSSLYRSTSCFPQSCPPNSIACLYIELIFKQTQDNPEIDQERSTFQICTYTFKDAIFARYTDGGNIMCSLPAFLHCPWPDSVPLDCSLGLVYLTDTQKFFTGSLLRPPNLFSHNVPGVCPGGCSHLFLLIFSTTLRIYNPLCSSWSCKQVGMLTCKSVLCQALFFFSAFLPNQSISSDSSTEMLLLMQCFCLFFNKPWLFCPSACPCWEECSTHSVPMRSGVQPCHCLKNWELLNKKLTTKLSTWTLYQESKECWKYL